MDIHRLLFSVKAIFKRCIRVLRSAVNRSHRLALCLSKQSTRCDSGLKKETTAQNKSSIILNKTISQIFYYDLLFLFYYFIIIPFIIFVVYYCSNIFVSLYIAARH